MLAQAGEADGSAMEEVVAICRGTGDRHLGWFAKLVENHMDGIVVHAKHQISSGKVEETDGIIKQLRRAGYGYRDDEYFFFNSLMRAAATRRDARP